MNTRLQHIDIAKGIGILLVVFGHNNIKGKLFYIIFSFHLPLFLFLSGLFFNADGKLKELMWSKFDSIIKPYLTTLIIVYPMFPNNSIINYLAGIIYSTSFTIPLVWGPLWFLTHLWAVWVFSWLFVRVTKLSSIKRIFQVLLLLLLLLIGFLIRRVFWQIPIRFGGVTFDLFSQNFLLPGLPLSIDIVFISGFFFLLGFLLKQKIFDFKVKYKYLIFSLLLFGFCHYYFQYTIDLNLRRYDHLIISTLEAISGIYMVLCISSWISRYKVIGEIFAFIGTGSLFILIFHYIFQSTAYNFLTTYYESNYFTKFCAFIIGSTIPLLIWELVKRNDYLSLLFLPLKSNKLMTKKK
ncbi:acyltransferase family protein [Sphaerospermopsis aphanizomenoides BCCUSP55]|uniref:acyltransferase family protein n=1 Tax=Sphaerospermopsis aphanizomenoides TaxID=459663 RepID=UPI0019039FE9|nr:acyltransferase family protein [Sphaerospermopsis aphanizomenoides]MBK1986071.1 acyltransferase family protein [Sphaerospermopsis aphanizomenoides BCCUSP55]